MQSFLSRSLFSFPVQNLEDSRAKVLSSYCVALNFCGSLFLQIDDFWHFAGTNFLPLFKTDFSCWVLIFAFFGKSQLFEIKTFQFTFLN